MFGHDLENIGRPPEFTPPESTFDAAEIYNIKAAEETQKQYPQALWDHGKRGFFKDQRAHTVGDILTVRVNISGEKAKLQTDTERSRTGQESLSIPNLLGANVKNIVGTTTPALNVTSNPSFVGSGKVDRKEDVKVEVSAVVVKVLPNGYLVIKGQQEVRLNFEIREIYITGIVRPQDISDDNIVLWHRIAEARIGYGGRGQITQFQQPAYGQQLLDVLSPF